MARIGFLPQRRGGSEVFPFIQRSSASLRLRGRKPSSRPFTQRVLRSIGIFYYFVNRLVVRWLRVKIGVEVGTLRDRRKTANYGGQGRDGRACIKVTMYTNEHLSTRAFHFARFSLPNHLHRPASLHTNPLRSKLTPTAHHGQPADPGKPQAPNPAEHESILHDLLRGPKGAITQMAP